MSWNPQNSLVISKGEPKKTWATHLHITQQKNPLPSSKICSERVPKLASYSSVTHPLDADCTFLIYCKRRRQIPLQERKKTRETLWFSDNWKKIYSEHSIGRKDVICVPLPILQYSIIQSVSTTGGTSAITDFQNLWYCAFSVLNHFL